MNGSNRYGTGTTCLEFLQGRLQAIPEMVCIHGMMAQQCCIPRLDSMDEEAYQQDLAPYSVAWTQSPLGAQGPPAAGHK